VSRITTHVLDTAAGRPAAAVSVLLEKQTPDGWRKVGKGATDVDGRCQNLLSAGEPFETGVYRLTFGSGTYFAGRGVTAFYPQVSVVFEVRDPREHHHVPLLLSPFGYCTYRGS
jgi:5-hydroxyisourate hydrolase